MVERVYGEELIQRYFINGLPFLWKIRSEEVAVWGFCFLEQFFCERIFNRFVLVLMKRERWCRSTITTSKTIFSYI